MSDDAPEIQTKITLSGSDEIEAAFDRMRVKAEQSFGRIDTAARQTAVTVQNQAKVATVETAAVVQTSEQQIGTLQRVAQALGDSAGYVADKVGAIAKGAAIAGAGLVAAVAAGYGVLSTLSQKSAREGEELLQLSRASGVSVEALTRYQYAADIAAGKSDGVAGAFKRVSDALIKFQDTGDEASLGLFTQVGLGKEVETGKLRTAEQVFARLGEQLKKIPDDTRRAKAAFDLLGAGAGDLLPVFTKSTGDLKALQEEAKKLGETSTSDLTDNTKRLEDIRRLNTAIGSIKDTIVDAFFPFVADGSDKIAAWINGKSEAIQEFAEGAAETVTTLFNDVTRLFNAPLSERVTKLSVDGKEIDLTKERLRNLVSIGREAGEAMEEAAEDGEEAAEDSAMRRIDLDEEELESFIKVGNQKIVYDEKLQKKYIEIDGKRVEVAKSNAAKILAYLSDAVSTALDGVTSQDAKALRFSNGFIAALYEPAQELRRLGLDVWDALSGKGLGARSMTVQWIQGAFNAVGDAAISARDAALALFGLTAADLPTLDGAMRAVQRTYASFRAGLAGKEGEAAVPWARTLGSVLGQLGSALVAVGEVAVRVGRFVGPYLATAFAFVADAFKAMRDVFFEGAVAPENAFAWINRFLPDAKAAFDAVAGVVTALYGFVRAKLATLFEGVSLESFKAGVAEAWETVVRTVMSAYSRIEAVVGFLIGVLDRVAKALGFKDWKELGIVLFVTWLISQVIGIGNVVSAIGQTADALLKVGAIGALALGLLIYGVVALAGAFLAFVGLPGLMGAAIAAGLTGLGLLAIKYRDEIKTALGNAADWVRDKWTRLKAWFTGEVLPAFGIGEKKSPVADVPMPEQPAAPAAPQRSGQIVLGTDGTWREMEDEEERTGTGAAGRRRMEEESARTRAETEAMRASTLASMMASLRGGREEGEIGADRVTPGMAQGTFGDFLNSLRALGGGLSLTTPFAQAPLALPQGGAGGLVPFAPNFTPAPDTLYGTPEAVENVIKKAIEAGVAVKTPRPRET
ncbi:hypothetical protein [Methylobacterium indicum]|uniref:Uncharacterized protein n=1 Tax=Methylobacterium indicum TaxID=1775910 RepID=A0A8H8WSL1_9HYPH|nr:hypothetical protein [Methylobacterium indicum]BCM83599.1 hypothetical protein mvi_20600 [Methylobacterium indicum]